jgi:hypothetical protein
MACWIRHRHPSKASRARRTTWKGSITAAASGNSLDGSGLEAGESVHRDDLDLVAPARFPLSEPLPERLFGTAFDHVEQPGWAGVVADRRQVDDHGDVLVAASSVAPDVLICRSQDRARSSAESLHVWPS